MTDLEAALLLLDQLPIAETVGDVAMRRHSDYLSPVIRFDLLLDLTITLLFIFPRKSKGSCSQDFTLDSICTFMILHNKLAKELSLQLMLNILVFKNQDNLSLLKRASLQSA